MQRSDVTGDALVSKPTTDAYRDNYDRIFRAARVLRERDERLQEADVIEYLQTRREEHLP